jgi:hypothetical protein
MANNESPRQGVSTGRAWPPLLHQSLFKSQACMHALSLVKPLVQFFYSNLLLTCTHTATYF